MKTGETCWFLDTHMRLQLSYKDGQDKQSVLLLTMTRDDAPPLHVHHVEDEVFHILEGAIRFQVGESTALYQAGSTLLAPQGVPHGFRVVSEHARMLAITRGGFEELVSSMGRPAEHDGAPPHGVPTPEMQAALAARCAAVQIDLIGPPID